MPINISMKIAKTSQFKEVVQDKAWFENWVTKLETLNGKQYQRFQLETALGKTHVWSLNTSNESLGSLVIFPEQEPLRSFGISIMGSITLGRNLEFF